jgi:hypothetical protein
LTIVWRAVRWLWAELPFVVVVAIILAAAGYLYAYPEHWRRATSAMALGVVLAGLLRLVLPGHRAGMLIVRRRLFDTACYLAMGAVIIGVDIRLH